MSVRSLRALVARRALGALAALVALGLAAPAAAEDVKGSRDHPELPVRFEGSSIVAYAQSEFDAYALALGPATGNRIEASQALEGRVTRIRYRGPGDASTLQMLRNYEIALDDAGFEVLFRCAESACGSSIAFPRAAYPRIGGELSNGLNQRYLAAKRSGPSGDVYVALYTFRHLGWGAPVAQLDVVEVAAMPVRMQTVDADAMGRAIRDEGRVALYALAFGFDSAELEPSSDPQLEEIAALLKAQPGLEVLVVGHSDAQGSLDYNLDLSRRRAAAVVDALAGRYGIARARLDPHGVGYLAPRATNRTEAGRAENRRVELVERGAAGTGTGAARETQGATGPGGAGGR